MVAWEAILVGALAAVFKEKWHCLRFSTSVLLSSVVVASPRCLCWECYSLWVSLASVVIARSIAVENVVARSAFRLAVLGS